MDLIETVHFYYEEGNMVFTEKYHIDKGFCCGHACRHCPYDYECVPEPKRSIALEMRNEAAEKPNTNLTTELQSKGVAQS